MPANTILTATAAALCVTAGFAIAANAPKLGAPATPATPAAAAAAEARVIDPEVLVKVVPGITQAQVKSLLGDPWRTVQYNDLDQIENQIWEYRGKDAHGTYRVHIEFDAHGKVVIVGKIPDKAGIKGTPAESGS